jgi:two-component system sensor histidine kinase ChiS
MVATRFGCIRHRHLPSLFSSFSHKCTHARAHTQADEHRLSQILFNLVGNACKFTRRGHISVHGSTLEVDGKPFLAIHVEDTGAGIPPESIGSLFQEFAQADNSETREFAGTGLGLAICRELVELHGGKVWVEST